MSTLVLPQSMVADRDAGIKANAQHVDDNFNALASAVNGKLDLDGTSTPTADLTMGNHKLTNVATPTLSGDAVPKGYLDTALYNVTNTVANTYAPLSSPALTGTPTAPTPSVSDNSTLIATTAFVIDVLEAMYPVGSVYIGTQNTCPMGAFFGTWTLVSSGKALWTGNGTNGDTTISAGLPNITGSCTDVVGGTNITPMVTSGVFSRTKTGSNTWAGSALSATERQTISFSAQNSNAIYGASTTVQPPAYVVNVWRRTA